MPEMKKLTKLLLQKEDMHKVTAVKTMAPSKDPAS